MKARLVSSQHELVDDDHGIDQDERDCMYFPKVSPHVTSISRSPCFVTDRMAVVYEIT